MLKPSRIAIILSFVIYLLPVFTIHAGFVAWPAMFLSGEWSAVLIALAGALVLQILTAYLFHWLLSRFGKWGTIGLLASLPLLFFAVNVSFLYIIPALILIEPDWSGDVGAIEPVCERKSVSIMRLPARSAAGPVAAGNVWLQQQTARNAALMSGLDCSLQQVANINENGQFTVVTGTGVALYRTHQGSVHVLRAGSDEIRALPRPDGIKHWNPILTADGRAVAWLSRGPAGSGGRPHEMNIKSLEQGTDKKIQLDIEPTGSLTLIHAVEGQFTLSRHRNEVLIVDAEGKTVWGPVAPEGTYNAGTGFRRIGDDGWIAWDDYRDNGNYRIVWSLPWGTGSTALPRGRSIESASASPDGRLIAYSSEANSYFNAAGRLVIMSTKDGKVLYRRELKQFSRTYLAFLDNDHIAIENFGDMPHGVTVYRLPSN